MGGGDQEGRLADRRKLKALSGAAVFAGRFATALWPDRTFFRGGFRTDSTPETAAAPNAVTVSSEPVASG